jgi:hypothetical protein
VGPLGGNLVMSSEWLWMELAPFKRASCVSLCQGRHKVAAYEPKIGPLPKSDPPGIPIDF